MELMSLGCSAGSVNRQTPVTTLMYQDILIERHERQGRKVEPPSAADSSQREPARASAGAGEPDPLFGLHSPTPALRSEEHTSELQSLMRISYAVFCFTHKTTHSDITHSHNPA